jgi:hypothetical protein
VFLLFLFSSDQHGVGELGEGRSFVWYRVPPPSPQGGCLRIRIGCDPTNVVILARYSIPPQGSDSRATSLKAKQSSPRTLINITMCETDIALLAVLLLFDPIWWGDQAVVKSSLTICQSLLNTVRGGRAREDRGTALPVASSDRDDGQRSIEKPRRERRATEEAADALSGESRTKRSVRFRGPPIELRRGFRHRPSPSPRDADHEGDPTTTTPLAAKALPSVVQPTLNGCRRAVASTLRQSRPNVIARRATHGSSSVNNTRATTASATTSSFMASFQVHDEML